MAAKERITEVTYDFILVLDGELLNFVGSNNLQCLLVFRLRGCFVF